MALSVSAARSCRSRRWAFRLVQLDEQHGPPVLLVQQVVQTRAVQQGLCGLYAAQLLGQLHAGSQACLPGRNAQALELCLRKAVVLRSGLKFAAANPHG